MPACLRQGYKVARAILADFKGPALKWLGLSLQTSQDLLEAEEAYPLHQAGDWGRVLWAWSGETVVGTLRARPPGSTVLLAVLAR